MVPHKDGRGSLAVIVSLGSPVLLKFFAKPRASADTAIVRTEVYLPNPEGGDLGAAEVAAQADGAVLMEPGAALVMRNDAFTEFAHGIDFDETHDDLSAVAILNRECLREPARAESATLERGARISVVMWEGC